MNAPIRVLYAEDNPLDADQTLEHFAAAAPEFEIEVVPTAERFLVRAAEGAFDLLLLDNHLPDMLGTDVLKALTRGGTHPPVVMVTGDGDDDLVMLALRLGAFDYVSKRTGYLDGLPQALRAVVWEGRAVASPPAPRRLLYIERHPSDVDLTLRHFADVVPHFQTQVAHTHEEALDLLLGPHDFDLVLCDLRMGGMSALDLLRELKRRPHRVPFIVLTSRGDEHTAIAAMKLGAYDYLIKREGYLDQLPFIVENAIARAQLEDARRRLEAELAAAALRESEDRYRLLVERSSDGILVVAGGRIAFANPAAVRLLGAPDSGQLLGRPVVDLVAEGGRDTARHLLSASEAGAPAAQVELTLVRRDGHEVSVEATGNAFTHEGRPAAQIVLRDITERQRLERIARRSQRLEAIGTLASGIAHDLNNALAPILMGASMLKEQYPHDTELLDVFEANARRGAEMVRQLLTFARGAEGTRVSVRPAHLLKEVARMVSGTFPKNIDLTVNWSATLPTVTGDPTQLHQVLVNLCVNARDAMPDGGALTIDARPVHMDAVFASGIHDARPGPYVAISVRDTGVGIPHDVIDRIFDPFFSTKPPDKGTGLGLSTVLGIVRGHGGCLQVYSQPGQGAEFIVYLPVEDSAAQEVAPDPPAGFQGQGECVLFVDDEAGVRQVARAVMERLGVRPITAAGANDGLVRAAEFGAQLQAVITDLHMPDMDGLAFVRVLRRMLPKVPVAVASGRLEEADLRAFQDLGIAARLDKPFTEAQLATTLCALLRPPRAL